MICNEDCFNCKYSDCKKDGITEQERQAQIINDMKADPKKVKNRTSSLQYYYAHRDEILQKRRDEYQKDPEKILKKNRTWRDNNRDRYNDLQIGYYYQRKQKRQPC